ncbi:hypothetical protein B0H13DRAFT_2655642 [Mycena leptocephala]|nr:hypothetical protein B0H13DRAFT_2655642 [Mycena leptocephala]
MPMIAEETPGDEHPGVCGASVDPGVAAARAIRAFAGRARSPHFEVPSHSLSFRPPPAPSLLLPSAPGIPHLTSSYYLVVNTPWRSSGLPPRSLSTAPPSDYRRPQSNLRRHAFFQPPRRRACSLARALSSEHLNTLPALLLASVGARRRCGGCGVSDLFFPPAPYLAPAPGRERARLSHHSRPPPLATDRAPLPLSPRPQTLSIPLGVSNLCTYLVVVGGFFLLSLRHV